MPGLCIIPERALADRECRGPRMIALLAIGNFTSRDGGGVWAANETLAEKALMDERDFRRAASWLVERGYVRKRMRYKPSGAQDTNLLQIVLDDPEEQLAKPSAGGGVESPTPPQGEGESTPPREGAVPPPPLGATAPPRGGGENPTKRTHLNDPSERELPPTPARAAQVSRNETATAEGLADAFEDPVHRETYLALRRAHRFPAAFDATLRKLRTPITGGAVHTWAEIGAALLSQAGNGETFNELRVRGYLRTAREASAAGRATSRVTRSDFPGGVVGLQAWQSAARAGNGQPYSAVGFWDLCRSSGLLQGMLTAATLDEIVQRLAATGAIEDAAAFRALVLHVEPWALAEIKFAKTREERLAAALASWVAPAQGAA